MDPGLCGSAFQRAEVKQRARPNASSIGDGFVVGGTAAQVTPGELPHVAAMLGVSFAEEP